MKIVMTGATGFIGSKLVARLQAEGHSIHTLGRRPVTGVPFTEWDPDKTTAPVDAIEGSDAVVHLAGEPVAQRWTSNVKLNIRSSRTMSTFRLIDAISKAQNQPRVFICASAIGYYGDRADEPLTEANSRGEGFLPDVCVEWEKEAMRARSIGLRVACVRTGLVLGKDGGALKQMLPAFRLGVGGPLGSGQQWMSWIHQEDIVSMFAEALTSDKFEGPVNGVSPNPVRNREFTKALGAALGRPALLPVPSLALKALFGEMSRVMLSSQRVFPEAAIKAGFEFRYPDLDAALKDVVKQ